MPSPLSPQMSLALPVPTVTLGPEYAEEITNNFSVLDNHNHTPGNGALIPVSALSINADLPMNNYGVISTKLVGLAQQTVTPSQNGSLYMKGNNLWWKSGTGSFDVQVTNNGTVNAAAGSISGLVSPASAVYSSVPGVIVFQSNTNLGADLDCRNLTLRNNVVSSPAYQILAPTLTGAASVTMPLAPASTKIMTMTSGGVMSAAVDTDNSSLEISSNTLQVKDLGISTAKLANLAVATGKIADGAVTNAKLAALNYQISSSSGNFTTTSLTPVGVTNLLVSITTTGRPIMILLVADGSGGSNACLGVSRSTAGTSASATFYVEITGVTPNSINQQISIQGASGNLVNKVLPGTLNHVFVGSAGTYSVSIGASGGFGSTAEVTNCKLVVYEL